MKKLILTLLLTSLASYSQTVNLDLQIKNIIPVDFNYHRTEATALIIPAGKIWTIQANAGGLALFAKPNSFSAAKNIYIGNNGTTVYNCVFLTGGTKVWTTGGDQNILINIIEFFEPSTFTGTLALNEIKEINNKIELFPNPTNSKIALNSEKNYTIEVYDMQGQIVMKDKGNTVDLSNLSNAVYILKAYDNYEKTTTSYKVVKK
jgi:hypothetical protein